MSSSRALTVAALLCAVGVAAPVSAADPVAEARAQVDKGDYRAALATLEPVLKWDHDNLSARMTAAEACVGMNDPDCAADQLKWVQFLAPKTPGFERLRGRMLVLRAKQAFAKGDEKKKESLAAKAAEAFSKALLETPGEPQILGWRAESLHSARRNREAIAAYSAWVGADPENEDAWCEAGYFLAGIGDWDKASALLAQVPPEKRGFLHDVRLAILRGGLLVVPWPKIQPVLESADAEETDPVTKLALRAYRDLGTDGDEALLHVLDYLDADPDDHAGVVRIVCRQERADSARRTRKKQNDLVLPTLVLHKAPAYPESARRARIAGRVLILARVRKDGSVGSEHVLLSPAAILSRSALDAVRKWHYRPGTIHGKPVEVALGIEVDFTLR